MQQSNLQFVREQLKKIVESCPGISDAESFVYRIELDQAEKQRCRTNFDEIMFYHVIPKETGKDLTFEEIVELLVAGNNGISLFVYVSPNGNKMTLSISKRFRPLKVIKEYHKDNGYMPFILTPNQ